MDFKVKDFIEYKTPINGDGSHRVDSGHIIKINGNYVETIHTLTYPSRKSDIDYLFNSPHSYVTSYILKSRIIKVVEKWQ